jgi:hypothetical protein
MVVDLVTAGLDRVHERIAGRFGGPSRAEAADRRQAARQRDGAAWLASRR